MIASFQDIHPPTLPAGLRELLPSQGSVELQNDGPGKTHNWNYHSLDEELCVLLAGVALFFGAWSLLYAAALFAVGAVLTAMARA